MATSDHFGLVHGDGEFVGLMKQKGGRKAGNAGINDANRVLLTAVRKRAVEDDVLVVVIEDIGVDLEDVSLDDVNESVSRE